MESMTMLSALLFVIGVLIGAFAVFFLCHWRHQKLREENIRLLAMEEANLSGEEKFEQLAQKIFGAQNEESRARLEKTLLPFQQNLNNFRTRLEDLHRQAAEGRSALNKHIENLHETSQQLSHETTSLTKALRRDKKMQGDWGEVILERILEQSGLEKGREYEVQTHYRNEEGRLLRPDVVVHLPDGKDIIIDSKVSLNAYVDYINEEDKEERKRLLQAHIAAIHNHIDELSAKDYEKLAKISSLNYVLLFFPIEAAFFVAQQEDSGLFERALRRQIILVTPATLLATLKVIHNIWSNEKRNRYAMQIAKEGGALYDKLHGFVTDLNNIDRSLQQATSNLGAAKRKLAEGRGNLLSRAEKMKELGADTKKELAEL